MNGFTQNIPLVDNQGIEASRGFGRFVDQLSRRGARHVRLFTEVVFDTAHLDRTRLFPEPIDQPPPGDHGDKGALRGQTRVETVGFLPKLEKTLPALIVRQRRRLRCTPLADYL